MRKPMMSLLKLSWFLFIYFYHDYYLLFAFYVKNENDLFIFRMYIKYQI